MLGINSEKQKMYLKSNEMFVLNIKVLIAFLYNSTLCDTIVFDELMNDEVIVWILIMSI